MGYWPWILDSNGHFSFSLFYSIFKIFHILRFPLCSFAIFTEKSKIWKVVSPHRRREKKKSVHLLSPFRIQKRKEKKPRVFCIYLCKKMNQYHIYAAIGRGKYSVSHKTTAPFFFFFIIWGLFWNFLSSCVGGIILFLNIVFWTSSRFDLRFRVFLNYCHLMGFKKAKCGIFGT